jgi:hypothetical protein
VMPGRGSLKQKKVVSQMQTGNAMVYRPPTLYVPHLSRVRLSPL